MASLLTLFLIGDFLFPPPFFRSLPSSFSGAAQQKNTPFAQIVLASDNTPLRAFPDQKHIWRHPVSVKEVSPRYLEVVLAYEDRWFYWHFGVNPVALLRAGAQWILKGKIISGGSTISMQVARMLEPALNTRSLLGKTKQILRAVQLEMRLSKDEILALYLTYAPMGGVLEGVEAASRAYLSKPSLSLSYGEAALLAVLPQAPSLLRPDRFPKKAELARNKVLDRLKNTLGDKIVREAKEEPIAVQSIQEPLIAPLFAQRVKKIFPQNARLKTTLDLALQESVEALISARLNLVPPRVSMAAMVVDNQTLEVRSYVGSADFLDNQRFSHVDMVQGKRSPGSTLKPFLYAQALDASLIHSESLLSDVPQSFEGYQPGNFQANFSGAVSVSEALQKSLNVPAVEVLDRLGATRFMSELKRGGLTLALPGSEPNLSIILGGASVNLEALVSAYTSLARGGIAGKPRYTSDFPIVETRMMSEGAAFIVRDILEAGGISARAIEERLGAQRGIAWKTGTSFGFRDAWAIGVSDSFTVGVWIGRPDGTPNPGFFGANIAAPLLVDIFATLGQTQSVARKPPESVKSAKICWPLGFAKKDTPDALCHEEKTAWVLNDAIPPSFADKGKVQGAAKIIDYRDKKTGLRVRANCAVGEMEAVEIARWPAALNPWLSDNMRAKSLPSPWHFSCLGKMPEQTFKIIGVSDGEIIRAVGEKNSAQKESNANEKITEKILPSLSLSVRTNENHGELLWLINGKLVARAAKNKRVLIPFPKEGAYRITAMDEAGNFDRVHILVR